MKSFNSKLPFHTKKRQFSSILILLLYLKFGTACAPMQVIDTDINQYYFNSAENEQSQQSIYISNTGIDYKPFPMDYNAYVKKWLDYFSKGEGKVTMRKYLERSGRYIAYMEDILAYNGLPKELVSMSMVESGFWPYATSHAQAVGYWQFIKPTGELYNLRIDRYVDDRRDFELSTQAAANYLKDLYVSFRDWRLSIAAYNCGEQCIRNAINKNNSKNFWHLVDRKSIPEETRNYVPKVIAMAKITRNPNQYGFHSLNYQEPLDYKTISIRTQSTLNTISNHLNISYKDLKSLNPKFKTDIIPKESSYELRVPIESIY
ncbi:MAG: lytic transglycosylase domain-containing protein [Bdellovibrionaceae bacterium]|nr:lytic transglycosylase domain-containing protein [Pseudobdellovibrionaceae bacterium]